MLKIYTSDSLENRNNCNYPHEILISSLSDATGVFNRDYVCVHYKEDYRKNDNFIESNCLPMDCDNDHSEKEDEWITVEDVKQAFPGVLIVFHYSRNHMKQKGDKSPRPRFHALFSINNCTDAKKYSEMKRRVNACFPYFDNNALDAARFFFGTSTAEIAVSEGTGTLDDFFEEEEFDAAFDKTIPEGKRNSTMSRYAARLLKKYGDTQEMLDAFYEVASHCNPALEEEELNTILMSARRFYHNVVEKSEGYKPPEEFNDPNSYLPLDFTDIGQAEVLAKYFIDELRYSEATNFIRYRGNRWQESKVGARAAVQELTRRQLLESKRKLGSAYKKLLDSGGFSIMLANPKNKSDNGMNDAQKEALKEYQEALAYSKFALQRRDTHYIAATMTEVTPKVEIETLMLDSDPFLLNTPNATFDLRKGLLGAREHRSDDLITKITNYSPSEKGKKVWLDALDTIFGKDQELIDYVQEICGLTLIGKIFVEACIFAYGEGGNGKSTFFNSIAHVVGDYYGSIASDVLTTNNKRNTQPEVAELRGKRIVIAAETQEGAYLDESMIKKMCSTDDIMACKKYKDPFYFKPSHTLILYTNHLPKVRANDDGTWRRIIVIPFKNKLTGTGDIKNYSDVLVEEAGEYIMTWLIEGAKKVIDSKFHIKNPKVVEEAIAEYRESNNWFAHFLEEKCDTTDMKAEIGGGELYQAYRLFALESGEKTRSTTDFALAVEKAGFKKVNHHNKRFYRGIKLQPCDGDFHQEILT